MSDANLDTALRRTPTGLDEGARDLILDVVRGIGEMSNKLILGLFFRDRFGGFDDYLAGVRDVWGEEISYRLGEAVADARSRAEFTYSLGEPVDIEGSVIRALLRKLPEPDFRTAVWAALQGVGKTEAAAARITTICRTRGIPWRFDAVEGFVFVGDEQVERDLVRPALAAVNLPAFAGGTKAEFDSAREELAKGTPAALKQAVHEAGCALESAMKVVLDDHGVPYGAGDTAKPLFEALIGARIVPRHMENLVLVAMTPRNRRGGHGAGATPHAVSEAEAGSIVAGAGGAIAYLATRLK